MNYDFLPRCPLCKPSSYFSIRCRPSRQAQIFYVGWLTWKSLYDTFYRHWRTVLIEGMQGLDDHYHWPLHLDLYHGKGTAWFFTWNTMPHWKCSFCLNNRIEGPCRKSRLQNWMQLLPTTIAWQKVISNIRWSLVLAGRDIGYICLQMTHQ